MKWLNISKQIKMLPAVVEHVCTSVCSMNTRGTRSSSMHTLLVIVLRMHATIVVGTLATS